MSHKRLLQTTVVALALLTAAAPAYAYLDPSTASMAISAIVGLFATASLAIKTYWYKLKSIIRHGETTRSDADFGEQSSSDVDSCQDS
jgi:hypothetical protein